MVTQRIQSWQEFSEATFPPDVLARVRGLKWHRSAQHFMVAQGVAASLTHVDWRQRAANCDAIDAVIGEMIAVED